MKEIILRLGSGSLETGFTSVNVEFCDSIPARLHQRNNGWEASSSLLAAPALKSIYQEWKFLYQASLRQPRGVKFAAATPTNFSIQDIYQITHNLTTALNSWLNQGDFYYKVQAQLRTDLNSSDRIILTIVTDDLLLWQLPWHRWNFLEAYDRSVEVFSKSQFKSNYIGQPQRNGRVDILAIWGNAPELDLAKDLAALKQPRANIRSYQPKSALEISDRLADGQVDILFFGGHGETTDLELVGGNQTLGTIYLDKDTPISIDKIRTDLKQAIERGLQIAIFNCCSGLGLAQAVMDLNIPYLIVMRSQISDRLAQQFCRDLLVRYSQGDAFVTAFSYARSRLKPASDRADEFESWLPILFHNPNSDRVTWQQLSRNWWQISLPQPVMNTSQWLLESQHLPLAWIGVSVLATGMTIGLKSIAPVQKLESFAIDRFQATQVAMMPTKSQIVVIDPSQDVIIVDGEYLSSDKPLESLADIPILALGIDLKIERQESKSLLIKSNIDYNCANSPPTMTYIAQINLDCQALAWQLIKHYPQGKELQHSDRSIVLNPYLFAKIEQIKIGDIAKYPPDFFKSKIGIVGVATDRSSPVIIQALAIDTLIRLIDNHQQLLTLIDQTSGTIYILLWSGLSSLSIFQIRRLFLISTGINLISIGTGWILFTSGYLVPLVPAIVVIGISSIFIYAIDRWR